eukprot:5778585-Pyramimonas_sp.AAC.1
MPTRPKKKVRITEYDMAELFKSCISLRTKLTGTDQDTDPLSGTPFGPELTSSEGGQSGPRGKIFAPAEEALSERLRIDAVVGPPDAEIHVGGPPMEGPPAPDPKPPAPSGILQPIAAKVTMQILRGARMACPGLLNA